MDGLCRDCQFWSAPDPRFEVVVHDEVGPGWGSCELGLSRDGVPVSETKAFAGDVEGHGASLSTRPDFGCVQFKARANGDSLTDVQWDSEPGECTVTLDNPRATTDSSVDQVEPTITTEGSHGL